MIASPNKFALPPVAFFDACATASTTVFDSTERLVALNLNTARALMEDGTAAVRALLAVKTPQDLAALQSATAQPTAEKTLAYYRGCFEILAQGLEEVVKPFELKMAEINKMVGEALEKAARSAPGGSEVALAAVQSAIAAANSTYDTVSKATRKAIEIAESNLSVATTTPLVKTAPDAADKAA